MNFEPAPANDFLAFMEAYHTRCRERIPAICAVAAKWTFEDLVPGLSDFDTRFILRDPMSVDDWQAMSLAVGEVHTEMARAFPRWHRNLEHLPGVNLTVAELTDPRLFYPEFQQWTFYGGGAAVIEKLRARLGALAWSERDELYHLKKIATFYGPYQRGIDPPVNLGPWENKYALHSRLMHWFTPPVQAMVSLIQRRNVPGKLEALRLARTLLPEPGTIDRLFTVLGLHYETPELYAEPRLSELERRLESYLAQGWAALAGHVTLVEPARGDDRDAVRAKVAAAPSDPVHAFFESAKFGRLLEGRLRFYGADVPGFDSAWLIRNEIGRIVPNFYTKPLTIYGRLRFDEELAPEAVLDRLRGDVLGTEIVEGLRRFATVAAQPIEAGEAQRRARAVAELYAPVLVATEALAQDLLQRTPAGVGR